MTPEELKKKPLLDNIADKNLFLCKPGPVYLFHGKRTDLRTIDLQTATALANDPGCMFLQWKDPNKRPQGQRAAFPAGDSTPATTDKNAGKGK